MIIKNADYQKSKNVTVAIFGNDDMVVTGGYDPKTKQGMIAFVNDPEKKIKDGMLKGRAATELNIEMVHVFNKPESIDVLINALEMIKDEMTNHP